MIVATLVAMGLKLDYIPKLDEIEIFNPIPGPSVSVPMPQPPQVPVPVIEPLEVSVPVPEVTRPKRIRKRKTNEELKRQFYFEKIKTEKLQKGCFEFTS
ncbi:hypothetical protein FQR65_LT18325 [Abscondita terminalis]|nr:hypothetical protein FQR65_LT18325 [Abscondita terminalis]